MRNSIATSIAFASLGFLTLVACGHERDSRSASSPPSQHQGTEYANDPGFAEGWYAERSGEASPIDRGDSQLEPASRTTPTPLALTEARCKQQQRCERVGPQKKYATAEECVAKIQEEWKSGLASRECTQGTNSSALDRCITEIRMQDCSATDDPLSQLGACEVDELCR
jgi:hypothetical protein